MISCKSVLSACKKDLIEIYKHAVDSVKPERLIRDAIVFKGTNLLFNDPNRDKPSSKLECDINNASIHVIGGGKSVLGMASALGDLVSEAKMSQKFSHGILSVPVGLERMLRSESIERQLASLQVECHLGSQNNLPDEGSVRATERILQYVSEACRADCDKDNESIFIVLISGGGSSCLTSPKSISLDEKLDIIKKLVQAGADIKDLNTVRRYYSNVKGGGLARHILECNPRAKIITLILSDVVGDCVEFIASGPTYLQEELTSRLIRQKAVEVLRKYSLDATDESPSDQQDVVSDLHTAVKQSSIINIVVGNNTIALNAASDHARSLGYEVVRLDGQLEGSTEEILVRLLSTGERTTSGRSIVLAGGEATVEKRFGETWGIGGRLQELCLDYMIKKLEAHEGCLGVSSPLNTDLLLAGSTDGQDGPTDVAACMVSFSEYLAIDSGNRFKLCDLYEAKKLHNSNRFWSNRMPDWLIKTGLTGTNVMDIFLLQNTRS